MSKRSNDHGRWNRGGKSSGKHALFNGRGLLVAGSLWAAGFAMPTVATAKDVVACQELKAAVADAQRGFAAHQGALAAPGKTAASLGTTYQAKKSMTGAQACGMEFVNLDDPKRRLRQVGYRCQFPAVLKLDQSLRTELSRCVAGEVDDPLDPYTFTIWVDRVSSGEGYRATEVTAVVNPVDGMTLWVRQSVCTNKGSGQACED